MGRLDRRVQELPAEEDGYNGASLAAAFPSRAQGMRYCHFRLTMGNDGPIFAYEPHHGWTIGLSHHRGVLKR